MNGRLARKIRKVARRRDREILPELKVFINSLAWWERWRAAGRIIVGRF